MGEVGTRKVYENEDIVMWEFFLDPGETTPVHTHRHDYVFYVVAGSTVAVLDANGVEIVEVPVETGTVMAFSVHDNDLVAEGMEDLVVPATHATRNVGTTTYREILVELK